MNNHKKAQNKPGKKSITSHLFLLLNCLLISLVFGYTPFSSDSNQYLAGFVTISTEHIFFGEVETTDTNPDSLIIFNGGDDTLSVAEIFLEGAGFELIDAPDELAPFSSNIINFQFAPLHNIDYSGFLFVRLSDTDQDILVSLTGAGDFPGTYYDVTANLWGEELKSTLHELIDDHIDLGYDSARDRMYDTIDNENGTIEGVYSGIIINAWNRTEAQAQGFDTEHTWPKSLGADNSPPKSDLHHLFPTYAQFNSTRGNLPFGIVVNSNWPSGVPNSSDSDRGYDVNGTEVFEPRDVHKGDVSRAMFYFAIRYNNPNNFLGVQENILRDWFDFDFVSQKEIERNDAIFIYQENRSPFVDHPEFLERISSLSGTANDLPLAPEIVINSNMLYFNPLINFYNLEIGNQGNDVLELENIEFSDEGFQFTEPETPILPGETASLLIDFTENVPGVTFSNLTISTNDSDESTITISLIGLYYTMGDVNLDFTVNIQDVIILVEYTLGGQEFSDLQFYQAELSGDSAIDILDIVALIDIILS